MKALGLSAPNPDELNQLDRASRRWRTSQQQRLTRLPQYLIVLEIIGIPGATTSVPTCA